MLARFLVLGQLALLTSAYAAGLAFVQQNEQGGDSHELERIGSIAA